MTQPDRRHLRFAWLAPCRRSPPLLAAPGCGSWRGVPFVGQSLTALASWIRSRPGGGLDRAAWGRRPRWPYLR